MPILLGPFDPIKIIFHIINSLIAKGLLSTDDAQKILKDSLDPSMSEVEKDQFIDSLFTKNNVQNR